MKKKEAKNYILGVNPNGTKNPYICLNYEHMSTDFWYNVALKNPRIYNFKNGSHFFHDYGMFFVLSGYAIAKKSIKTAIDKAKINGYNGMNRLHNILYGMDSAIIQAYLIESDCKVDNSVNDSIDLINVAIMALYECKKASPMDKKGKPIPATLYAFRQCQKFIYSVRSVDTKSQKAQKTDEKKANDIDAMGKKKASDYIGFSYSVDYPILKILMDTDKLNEFEKDVVTGLEHGYNQKQIAYNLNTYAMKVNRAMQKIRCVAMEIMGWDTKKMLA